MSSKDRSSPNGTTSFSCVHPYLVIAYLTECALATIAITLTQRGASRAYLERHIDIAQYGVDYLRSVGIDTASIHHLPRLVHLLSSDNTVRQWVNELRSVLPK